MVTFLVIAALLCAVEAQIAKDQYFMDKQEDCVHAGYLEIPDNKIVTLHGRTRGSSSSVLTCSLRFQTVSANTQIEISFTSYTINDCTVLLIIYAKGATVPSVTYSCADPMPGPIISTDGSIIIKLDKRNLDDQDFNYLIKVRAFKPNQSFTDDNTDVNIPLVAGIIAGVIVFLIILAIICVCCYKKRHKDKTSEDVEVKMNLDEDNQGNRSYGYSNELARNGNVTNNEFDSPRSQKKLLGSNSRDFSGKTYPSENKKTPLIDSKQKPPNVFNFDNTVAPNERSVDRQKNTQSNESQSPKSPMLEALHSNPKFRKSFKTNEQEAETRANRISGYVSESQESQASAASVPEFTPPPPLPKAPKAPKSPKPLRHHASIRRAFRQSSSTEEMNLYDDNNIKVIRDNDDPPSPSEIVPIKVNDPHAPDLKTKHTLRPNRGKSTSSEANRVEETYEREREPPNNHGGFQRNNSLRKRSTKSPRLGRSSRGSAGHDLDDVDSIGRPVTPTSMMFRDSRRDEDAESYAPLRRTDSRQSLYASRSSLYGRKSRRERSSSIGESVSTYAMDDLDSEYMYRMPRRGYDRGFRSMGDIVDSETREMREKETQTLRESGTQTGKGQAIIAQPKKYVRNQSIRKGSAAGVSGSSVKDAAHKAKQNGAKTKERPPKETKSVETQDTGVGGETPTTPKLKPKPKPKPVPRKKVKSTNQAEPTNPEENNTEQLNEIVGSTDQPNLTQVTQAMMQPQFIQPGMMAQGPGGVMMLPYYPPGSPMPQGYYPIQPGMMPGYPANAQLPNIRNQPAPVMQSATLPHPDPSVRHHSSSPIAPGYTSTSGKPSSWDMLCAISDAEKRKTPSIAETGSVTGSVFSSVAPPNVTNSSQMGYNPRMYNAGYLPSISGSYQQTVPTAYNTNPGVGYVPSINGRFTPADASSGHYSPAPGSDHGSPGHISLSPVPISFSETSGLHRKDSWGMLKELTEQNKTNGKQESIV